VIAPKNLLLLDFFGATATALATGMLLATEVITTGLPTSLLWGLSLTAAGLAVFGIGSYRLATDARRPLAIVAVLNLLYCATAVAICVGHWASLTHLGVLYFGLETAIVVPLAFVELLVANRSD
jgi:hypothetical protein